MTQQTETSQRPVLVVDFGAQYAQLIARRVREAGVYSEIVPHTASAAEIAAKNPVGIILSGGPSSVYEQGAPALDAGVFELGVPTLGICYGFQVMAQALGGEVANTGLREYGATDAALTGDGGVLLAGQPAAQNVWMSHGDQVSKAPEGFDVLASHLGDPRRRLRQRRAPPVRRAVASRGEAHRLRAARHRELPPQGRRAPGRLEQRQRDRRAGRAHPRAGRLGPRALRALGRRRLRGRRGPRARGRRRPAGLRLRRPRAAAQGRARAGRERLRRLHRRPPRHHRRPQAVPRRARRVSAIRSRSARSSGASSSAPSRPPSATSSQRRQPTGSRSASSCRARSTPTSSSRAAAPAPPTSSRITTWADSPKTSSSSWSSPSGRCSRTRCGPSAASWACPRQIVGRQPFPGPGLGIRIVGEVTADRLEILRDADAIAREELSRAGLDGEIWQCPVVLLADVRSVGVQGDGRTYGHPIVLRPVSSEDAMTADWTRLPVRRAGAHLEPDHERGARGQPRRARRHVEAAGHHRVGVSAPSRPSGGGPGE